MNFWFQEPTSGLDSALAFETMSVLEQFASEKNRTVLVSIHQPSSQIFHMCSKILLIGDGQVILAF